MQHGRTSFLTGSGTSFKTKTNISTDGATPKVTRSARLSSSMPKRLLVLVSLATNPSKTSKIMPKKTHIEAWVRRLLLKSSLAKAPKEIIMALTPMTRLQAVTKLGRIWIFFRILSFTLFFKLPFIILLFYHNVLFSSFPFSLIISMPWH